MRASRWIDRRDGLRGVYLFTARSHLYHPLLVAPCDHIIDKKRGPNETTRSHFQATAAKVLQRLERPDKGCLLLGVVDRGVASLWCSPQDGPPSSP